MVFLQWQINFVVLYDKRSTLTSKYRKNEYMSRYNTMNGANIALRMPMKMKRRRSLVAH